jgi:hypothetical protein
LWRDYVIDGVQAADTYAVVLTVSQGVLTLPGPGFCRPDTTSNSAVVSSTRYEQYVFFHLFY